MGANTLQALFTCATRIVAGEAAYLKGNPLRAVEHIGPGLYQLDFDPPLNADEQQPYFTPIGTDPTTDYQVEIVGGGPVFSQLIIHTNIGGNPADVDGYFLMEQIRVEASA
jgi:hypothetical protein